MTIEIAMHKHMWRSIPVESSVNPLKSPDYHLCPAMDLRSHEIFKSCWCNPHKETDEYGSIYTHRSMDGREAFERGIRKVS